jgi:transposase
MEQQNTLSYSLNAIIEAILNGTCTEAQSLQLAQLGPEAIQMAVLAATQKIAQLNGPSAHPSTPSGQIPVYTKANRKKRRTRRGAKPGHPAARRKTPEHVDARQDHRCDVCPDCGGPLQRCNRSRKRVIEDIPKDIETEITEHTIHRDYCPHCQKHVEPVVPDAFPKASLGHRFVCFTAWLHYGLGVTLAHIKAILGCHLHTTLSSGGLLSMWYRLAEVLTDWYEQIGQQARDSGHLHADETGWRVSGRTHWLWCFANGRVCYYLIDRSRGSPALQRFFTTLFEGVLITDFWAAYNSVEALLRQCCHAHLLRELNKTDEANDSQAWRAFSKTLRRLIMDAIRLRRREDFTPDRYARRIDRIEKRLTQFLEQATDEADVNRLLKRLRRHQGDLFTFLHRMDVAYDNNLAERQIRPAVILRKNSQCNHSEKGAATQAVMMSVYQTLKLRGLNPLDTLVTALTEYMKTGQLPPLPEQSVAHQ